MVWSNSHNQITQSDMVLQIGHSWSYMVDPNLHSVARPSMAMHTVNQHWPWSQ
jgi:hypothetical protein